MHQKRERKGLDETRFGDGDVDKNKKETELKEAELKMLGFFSGVIRLD